MLQTTPPRDQTNGEKLDKLDSCYSVSILFNHLLSCCVAVHHRMHVTTICYFHGGWFSVVNWSNVEALSVSKLFISQSN